MSATAAADARGGAARVRTCILLFGAYPDRAAPAADAWMSINQQVLDSIGGSRDSLARLSPAWVNAIPARLFGEARAYLAGRINGASTFALEDPYLSRLWPFWLKVLDEAGIRVAAIHLLRRPAEAAPANVAQGPSAEDWAALWTRCTVEAEAIPVDRLLVDCDAMLADPAAVGERLHQWLGGIAAGATAHVDREIAALLTRIGPRHGAAGSPNGSIEALAEITYRTLTDGSPAGVRLDRALSQSMQREIHRALDAKAACTTRSLRRSAAQRVGAQSARSAAADPWPRRHDAAPRGQQDTVAPGMLAAMPRKVAELESDLTAAVVARDLAATYLAQKAAALDALAHEKELTDRHVANLEALVAARARELADLQRSRSWRVTEPLRMAARLWRRVLIRAGARAVTLGLVPGSQLEVSDSGEFQATGHDPWFTLDLPKADAPRGLARGWYRVRLRGVESADVLRPKLYFDFGTGFSETASSTLPEDTASGRPAFVHIKRRATRLRLDPADRPVRFRLETVEMLRVSPFTSGAWLVRSLVSRTLRPPGLSGARLRKAWSLWREHGFDAVADRLVNSVAHEQRSYEHWVALYDVPTAERLRFYRAANDALSRRPRISILLPAYNAPERWLRRCIESVIAQTYREWELCIADDASTAPHVAAVLAEYARSDERIKTMRRETNGHISAATNSALALASGEFVALLDHDDELAPWALYWIAATVADDPAVCLVYSDEDKIGEDDRRFDPYFKPGWNPELLRAQNYLCHLSAYRRSAVIDAGGFREGFEGSQDWDLALRVTDRCRAQQIRHVPRILYHWRAVKGSRAHRASEKDYATAAGERAVTESFARLGIGAAVERTAEGYHRIRYAIAEPAPLVSIIIPTRNGAALVRECLESILRLTEYRPYEILLIDNQSDDPTALAYFEQLAQRPQVRVLRYDAPFNFSAINNFGASAAAGEILLLLNNDIGIIHGDWLRELVSYAAQPGNGAVGAKLLYPDETIQHAGVVVGFGGVAGHAALLEPRSFAGQMARCRIAQNMTAVTGACLAVRKSVYFEAGGFDEQCLRIAFNDVDFCLKVAALGYRNVFTPHVELFHHESASRGYDTTPEKQKRFESEVLHMQRKWGDTLLRDPAYNPNLDLDRRTFALAFPPRVTHPSL